MRSTGRAGGGGGSISALANTGIFFLPGLNASYRLALCTGQGNHAKTDPHQLPDSKRVNKFKEILKKKKTLTKHYLLFVIIFQAFLQSAKKLLSYSKIKLL